MPIMPPVDHAGTHHPVAHYSAHHRRHFLDEESGGFARMLADQGDAAIITTNKAVGAWSAHS